MLQFNLAPRKACSTCKLAWPIDAFHRHRYHSDGRASLCRWCKKIAAKAQYAANKDAIQAQHRAYEASKPGAKKARDARCYEEHKEQRRQVQKLWLSANKQRKRDADRAWYKANRERAKENRRRSSLMRRARERGIFKIDFSNKDLHLRISVFGNNCAYCGGPYEQLDHVKPVVLNGPHILANIRPACKECNQRKNRTPAKVWLANIMRKPPLPLP